jgi:ligand-binding sensor domain-containing protein/DNA-binding CsgD family transcriptional regulator
MMKRTAFRLLGILFLTASAVSGSIYPGRYHRFERLTPQTATASVVGISSICQDGDGYLWAGTSAGLARYDGYRFIFFPVASDDEAPPATAGIYPILVARSGDLWVGTSGQGLFEFSREMQMFVRYRHDPQDPDSLSDDIVLAIQEDAKGDLWVGTRLGGLNRYDRQKGSFIRFPLGPDAEVVWDVLADRNGNIWAGTLEAGLFKIDPQTGNTVNFRHIAGDPLSLGSDAVWTVFEDPEGTIWAGTKGGGLNRYDPGKNGFARFYGDGDFPRDLASQTITAIAEDKAGKIWLGTSSDGLRIWDRTTGEYVVCKHDPQDPESLGDDYITSVYQDISGIMWVGTVRGGLNKCLTGLAKFEHYKHNSWDPGSLGHNDVRALWADGEGKLWVGLKTGLETIDGKTGAATRFPTDTSSTVGPGNDRVLAIQGDSRGGIWLGTDGVGLVKLDPVSGTFTHFRSDRQNPNRISNNKVNALWVDRGSPGVLWVGTQQGLNRFEAKTGRWVRFLNDPQDEASLVNNIVTALHEDGSGSLWVGTRGGLSRLDKSTGKCENYVSRLDNPPGAGINDNIVNCILEGRDGVLWVGTERGLNRFDRAKGEWRVYAQKDGLAGEVVCAILEDTAGALWMSTNRGLSKLDQVTGNVTNFGLHDGVQGRSFNPGACFKDAGGRMFFGGTNGFNAFDPEAIQKNPFVPPVVWTAFYRNNEEVRLPRSTFVNRNLTLTYKTGLASFEFAALLFMAPELNTFAYRLEPRDADWTTLVPGHQVSLYNTGAGRYTLRVKASNPDGIWNEEGISIGLSVLSPFWRTPAFILITAAFLLSGAVMAVRAWKKVRSSPLAVGENLDAMIGTYGLTAREQEILRLVLQGTSNKDIAGKLFISASTVRNHIYNIYQKLEVRNRLELINRIGRDARNRP